MSEVRLVVSHASCWLYVCSEDIATVVVILAVKRNASPLHCKQRFMINSLNGKHMVKHQSVISQNTAAVKTRVDLVTLLFLAALVGQAHSKRCDEF